MYQRSASELTITITKLSEYGLSIPQFVMAVMLVVLGVLTYYVAPSAFLFEKFEVFFFILNLVLLMMIIGLIFISVLVLPQLQKYIIQIFLFFARKDRKLTSLIEKNLQSH